MRIYFRHGLYRSEKNSVGQAVLTNVGAPGVVARVTNSPIVWSIAHHDKNYTVSEHTAAVFATPSDLVSHPQSWMYVNLDLTTGKKTYGITHIEPIVGLTSPQNPANDQHWFDLKTNTTRVYSTLTLSWHERVRLVFGHWDGSTFSPYGFGSSINLNVPTGTVSGTIMFDGGGKALKDSRGRFVTTEDKMFTDAAATHDLQLEANITRAVAAENIPAFHVVKWVDFDKVALASYEDTTNAVLAITLNDALYGDPVELCIQGKIINDSWDWPAVNMTLWVHNNGEFTGIDPFEIEPHTKARVPCARVLGRNTILFDQGLGGVGERGESGDVMGIVDASQEIKGVTRLSVDPEDLENPIAVGDNDPRLTAPRVPLEHGHPATQISVSPFAAFTGQNAQQALLYLHDAKLSKTGGTVTGNVVSTVEAVLDTHLVTLGGVNRSIEAARIRYKRFDLNNSPQPTITQAFNSLSIPDRTLNTNDIVFVVYRDDVFVWTGGTGLVVASGDSQFAWIGKINFETPRGDVIIKIFAGELTKLPALAEAE